MWKIINKWRRFTRTAWIKSLFFNLYMLPFKDGIKMPVLLARGTHLFSLEGRLKLLAPASFGMIRFGYINEDFVPAKKHGINLCIKGTLCLGKWCRFSPGTTLRIYSTGTLTFHDNIAVGFGTKFFCMDNVDIGSDTRFGFEVVVTDTTFHYMRDCVTQTTYPLTAPVKIGNHNWIGARSYLMKGCTTPRYTIISAGSFCNKSYDIPEYCLLAGSPAKVRREGIYRCLDEEEDAIKRALGQNIQ